MPPDIIIVGAGPAGTATALHAAAAAPELAGRILVLDKATFPRDKFCAGAVGERAFTALAAIGVTVDVPMVRIHCLSLASGRRAISADEGSIARVVRRSEFDRALVDAVRARGVEVREDAEVASIREDTDGVTVVLHDGSRLRARFVIGADGVGSIVRRCAYAAGGDRLVAQAVEVDTEFVLGDPEPDTLLFDLSRDDVRGYVWDFPTPLDGKVKVCRGVYALRGSGKRDVAECLREHLRGRGLDPSRYRFKRYAERGWTPSTTIHTARTMLVGEAAGIDIATGEGIAQAIAYGAAAGPFAARMLRAQRDLAAWSETFHSTDEAHRFRVRYAGYQAFYSEQQRAVANALVAAPSFARAGARDFAGRKTGALLKARLAVQLGRHVLGGGGAGLGEALRTVLAGRSSVPHSGPRS